MFVTFCVEASMDFSLALLTQLRYSMYFWMGRCIERHVKGVMGGSL